METSDSKSAESFPFCSFMASERAPAVSPRF